MKKAICFLVVLMIMISVVFPQSKKRIIRSISTPTDIGVFSISGGTSYKTERIDESIDDNIMPQNSESRMKGNVKAIRLTDFVGMMSFGEFQIQGITYSLVSKFDQKGKLIEKNIYDSDSVLINKSIYKYDFQDKHSETDCFNSADLLVRKFLFKYDSRGNHIETNISNSEGSLEKK